MAEREGSLAAAEATRRALRQHPLSAGLHLLHALLLLEVGNGEEGVAALRRARYLDPGAVPARLPGRPGGDGGGQVARRRHGRRNEATGASPPGGLDRIEAGPHRTGAGLPVQR